MSKKKRYLRKIKGKKNEQSPKLIEAAIAYYEQNQPLLDAVRSYHEQNQPLLDAVRSYHEQNQPLLDAVRSYHEQNQPLIDAVRSYHERNEQLIDIQKVWYEQFRSLIEMCNNIDWDLIGEDTAERIKYIEGILKECEEEHWCLDFEILDAIEGREITQELISEYVRNNLDSYIEQIINDPMYELHATLIKETYEAFKGGYYKLCAMPLFAAFEHVLATWADGNIKNDFVSVREKPKVYSVKAAIKSEQYSKIEEEQFTKVFVLSIIRMLEKTFIKVPDKLCKVLNRNSIAHGFHDYDSINEINILKLFQLLKSTLIIRHFDSGLVKNKMLAES